MTEITTYYLEIRSLAYLRDKEKPETLEIVEAEIKEHRFKRYLYQLVGQQWQWRDKLSLSDTEWKAYAENDNLRTWVAYARGSIACYYELQKKDRSEVEIAYLGLVPKFVGKGYGGYLLTHAIKSA